MSKFRFWKEYSLSKDYEYLYNLLMDNEKMKVVCIVNHNHLSESSATDIATVVSMSDLDSDKKQIAIMTRGYKYSEWMDNLNSFIMECRELNLVWINPMTVNNGTQDKV